MSTLIIFGSRCLRPEVSYQLLLLIQLFSVVVGDYTFQTESKNDEITHMNSLYNRDNIIQAFAEVSGN